MTGVMDSIDKIAHVTNNMLVPTGASYVGTRRCFKLMYVGSIFP